MEKRSRDMTMEAPSKFAQLPAELLLKILDEADNRGILSCTDISPFLRTAGVDILLRRHNVLDPSDCCEVQAIVPGCLSKPPLPDAISALLASNRRYPYIRHLYCTIRPPKEYDERFRQRDPEEISFMSGDNPLPKKLLPKRLELTFKRLGELLARVEVVGEVTLKVLDWREFPTCFSNLLEEFVHAIIRSGCTSLRLQCRGAPFKGKLWSFPAPVEHPPRGLNLSSVFSTLWGFLGSSASRHSRAGHLGLDSTPSPSLAFHPRITKLDIDSTFFHPSAIQWTSDLLRHSPITELAVSSKGSQSSPSFQVASEGITAILEGVPRLQSLSLLEFNSQDIQDIAPRLRPFTALKNLRISLKGSCLPRGFGEGAATPFCPSNLERLSISPKIIGYMLLGTVTALNLKEIEIIHGTFDMFDAQRIVDGVATIHDFFSKIQAPISIAVTLACEAYRIVPNEGEVKMDRLTSLRSMVSLPLAKDLEVTKARIKGNLPWIDTLSLELYPSALCSLNSDNVGIILDLIGFFEGVRKVVVGGVKDFRIPQGHQQTRVPDVVPKAIVQPAFSRCRGLTSLWIGEDEYLRPLVEI